MSTLPRTPLYFPRMKIRGHRNRAKAAQRIEMRVVIPHARVFSDGAGRVTLTPQSEPAVGTVRVVHSQVHDGFGRSHPVRYPIAPPKPKPNAFSMSFKLADVNEQLLADLFFKHDPAPSDLADRMVNTVRQETNR